MFTFKTTILVAVAVAATLAGATAGQAGSSMPLSSCAQTVTTNVYLTQNLDCSGDGIVVGANGVTIDLKGHSVNGDRGAGDYGIDDSNGYDSLKIKNGAIRNFEVGVSASNDADNVSLTGVIAGGNSQTGIYVAGQSASVQTSDASGNGLHGVDIVGSNTKIKSSTAAGNGSVGMKIKGDATSVVSSIGSGNLVYGIAIYGDMALVKQSTGSGNGEQGILVQGDAPKVDKNHASGNGFAGGVNDVDGSGIWVSGYATPPVGTNVAESNDDFFNDCMPATLC